MLVGAHESAAGGWSKALQRAREDDCRAVQLFTKSPSQWREPNHSAASFDEFRKARVKLEFDAGAVVVHDSYLINLSADTRSLRNRSREALSRELERCEMMGADFLVIHPGAHKGQGRDVALRQIEDAVVSVLEGVPNGHVSILFENTAGQGTYLGGEFRDLGYLFHHVRDRTGAGPRGDGRVGICFDTCHAFVAGYDIRGARGVERTVDALQDHVPLDAVKVFHFNDTEQSLGSRRDRHARLGEGQIGWETFASLLAQEQWARCPAILETPSLGRDRMFRQQIARLQAMLER